MAAQRLDDLNALADIHAEVGAAGDQVALVEVIGPDAHAQQAMDEGRHHPGVVVDPAEQHRLVAQRHPGVAQALARLAQILGALLRMIDVDAHPDRTVLLEHLAQLRRDALRQENRDARADADELHVLDRAQPAEDVVELAIRQQQWIAAAQQDVAHLRMLLDVAQPPLVFRVEVVVLRIAHQPAPRAVAAIGGAPVGDQKQDAVGITVDQPGHRHRMIFAHRIQQLLGRLHHLTGPGNDLFADRAEGVVAVDQVEKVGRDREGQLVVGVAAPLVFLGGKRHQRLELR